MLTNEEDKHLDLSEQPSLFSPTLRHQATATSFDAILEYPWYQQLTKSEFDAQIEETSVENALQNKIRPMIDDEEPIDDSSSNN